MANFNLDEFVNNNAVFTTKIGNPVSFVCWVHNKPNAMIVKIKSLTNGVTENVRYCTDGNKYKGNEDAYSIVKVA